MLRVIRYRSDPAASSAMSAVTPKAEVNSERERPRYGPLRVDDPAVGVIQALKPEPRIMRYELNDFEWTATTYAAAPFSMRTDDSNVELINQRNQQFLLALRIWF
jgi:hypothetical protein